MVISRPAPVLCPQCRAATHTVWNRTFTRPLTLSCTSCLWFIDFVSFRYAQRLLLDSVLPEDRAYLERRLARRLARIQRPQWIARHTAPRMATQEQPDTEGNSLW